MCFRIITDDLPFLSSTERGELQKLKQNPCSPDFTIVKRFYDVTGGTFEEAARNLEIEAAKTSVAKPLQTDNSSVGPIAQLRIAAPAQDSAGVKDGLSRTLSD
jgi:hypothetical protein